MRFSLHHSYGSGAIAVSVARFAGFSSDTHAASFPQPLVARIGPNASVICQQADRIGAEQSVAAMPGKSHQLDRWRNCCSETSHRKAHPQEVPNRMPNAKTTLFALLLLALVLATAGLLVPTLNVCLLILAGLLFGVFVHAISAWSANKFSLAYRTTYLMVVGLLLLAIGLGTFQLGSQVADRADELWNQLQSAAQTANEQLEQHAWAQRHLPDVSDIEEQLTQSSSDILPAVLQRLQSLGWGMTAAMVIFFVGLYAAYDPDLYRDGLVKLMPPAKRERTQKVLDRMNGSLQRWIVARFVSMAIVGIATAIGMWTFGIAMPITLGVLAALLTFIPNIGPLLAAIPQMLLAVNVGPQMVLYVLMFNVVLQTFESYLITPIVQQREVSLPPVLTIAAQLLMGVVVGILGVMMAAPMVVVAMVLVQTLYIDDRPQDDDSPSSAEQ